MKQVDEIIYDAICADEGLMELIGGSKRVTSTCFETPPDQDDNTPVPNIIITDDGFQAQVFTKDDVWECGSDIVNVGVEFTGHSPHDVKRLRRLIRKAVDSYVKSNETDILSLRGISYDGVQWFWEKPCYYDTLHYSCDMVNDLNDTDDEQEDE